MHLTRARRLGTLALSIVALLAVALGARQPAIGAAPAPAQVFLPFAATPPISVASVLTPFDVDTRDLSGPASWATTYGKSPELVVASDGSALDVLAQDYDPDTAWSAVLLHIEHGRGGYGITQALTQLPMLDRVMGLAVDADGNRYYATGVDESGRVNATYPPLNTYRSDIVRVVKVGPAGDVLFNIDLDIARHAFDSGAEMIINPMVAATARLAVGGNALALVHGINTDPDWSIGGARHQKALATWLDASTGAVTRSSSIWVSHSFDQRLLYDGQGIVEYHLGDAYPRAAVLGRNHSSYPLLKIKGSLGDNNTYTRLGNVALIAGDPTYRYLALFATESDAATGSAINGSRNLAVVRVRDSDTGVDTSLPDALTVDSEGKLVTNQLRWLTSYGPGSNLHAERPKLVAIGGDQYIVLWEQWSIAGSRQSFNGVYAMRIDSQGNTLRPATLLTKDHHLPRGDDAFVLDGRAGWMTGDAATKQLRIHLVDASLSYQELTLN